MRSVRCISVLSIAFIRAIGGNCIHLFYLSNLLCKQLPAFIRELRGKYNPVFINRIYSCIRGNCTSAFINQYYPCNPWQLHPSALSAQSAVKKISVFIRDLRGNCISAFINQYYPCNPWQLHPSALSAQSAVQTALCIY